MVWRLILPGRQNISLLMTVGIGIGIGIVIVVGVSLIGGVVLGLLAYSNNNGGIPWMSIVGGILAVIGVLIYGRTPTNRH